MQQRKLNYRITISYQWIVKVNAKHYLCLSKHHSMKTYSVLN